ncbi:sensor histidine kinase [Paenibacillus macerans]|uniref:sensor histidine kinase n=1 Tax=Paenibacillus macerans TaxID=44252 RepID=UPI003D31F695
MKLIYRLNLSFGLLLLCVIAMTAAVMYPLLLNSLIDNERKELRDTGSRLIAVASRSMPLSGSAASVLSKEAVQAVQSAPAVPAGEVALVAYRDRIVYSSLPDDKATEWLKLSRTQEFVNGVWRQPSGNYVVETMTDATGVNGLAEPAVSAIMATPMNQIESVQSALFLRMMIVLAGGGIVAFLLSTYITKRLVTPLSKLRQELKKVEHRRFSDVRLVEADGEIGEVSRSVCRLAAELDKYQLAQREFFQNASHELKTPLMSIQGYAEGIKDGVFEGEKAEKGLGVIISECARLKKIVTELILLAKLESEDGIFHADRVSVRELVDETVMRINPLLVQNGLELRLSDEDRALDRTIFADREKLLQALINVAGNATRYAKRQIDIGASVRGDALLIEIADDGDGIAEPLLPRLFQRFAKGKNGETGLGLAISRAIVERCRGRITAGNRPEGGARFTLSFPIKEETSAAG